MQLPTLLLFPFAATANAFQLQNYLRPKGGCVVLDHENAFNGTDIDLGGDDRLVFTPRCHDNNCKHDEIFLILVVFSDAGSRFVHGRNAYKLIG
jgi:hypothetical protein